MTAGLGRRPGGMSGGMATMLGTQVTGKPSGEKVQRTRRGQGQRRQGRRQGDSLRPSNSPT